jgi:hypothetical protein
MARFAQRSKQELHVQAGGLDAAKTVLAPGSGRSLFLLTSPLIGHSENPLNPPDFSGFIARQCPESSRLACLSLLERLLEGYDHRRVKALRSTDHDRHSEGRSSR